MFSYLMRYFLLKKNEVHSVFLTSALVTLILISFVQFFSIESGDFETFVK